MTVLERLSSALPSFRFEAAILSQTQLDAVAKAAKECCLVCWRPTEPRRTAVTVNSGRSLPVRAEHVDIVLRHGAQKSKIAWIRNQQSSLTCPGYRASDQQRRCIDAAVACKLVVWCEWDERDQTDQTDQTGPDPWTRTYDIRSTFGLGTRDLRPCDLPNTALLVGHGGGSDHVHNSTLGHEGCAEAATEPTQLRPYFSTLIRTTILNIHWADGLVV